MKNRCIIVGAGEFLEKKIDINENDYIIAADGGYKHCLSVNVMPHLVVSDFDSYHEDIQDVEVIRCVPEKDDTDMLLAIHEGIKRGCDEFVIYGALGGRLEHTFANIQCLKYLCEQGFVAKMISKDCCVQVIRDVIEFNKENKGYISVFSLSDLSVVTIENLKYTLDHGKLNTSYPLGIDNEFIGKKSKITVHEGFVLVITNKE